LGERVPLEAILTHPHGFLICWPRWDAEAAEERVEELGRLGVEAVIFEGPHIVETIPILGKGNTSLVLKVDTKDGFYAAKVRRTDADRTGFDEEARLMRVANTVGVGPKLISWGRFILLMEFIEGRYLSEWIRGLTLGDAESLRHIIRSLLLQAQRLDGAGLDHGELVRLRRHVMLRGGEPVIIDFESASTGRRVANVTTVLQSLFLNNNTSRTIGAIIQLPEREILLDALHTYRKEMSTLSFEELLRVAGLEKDFTFQALP
jgi:putative serine/threonine protein kinase